MNEILLSNKYEITPEVVETLVNRFAAYSDATQVTTNAYRRNLRPFFTYLAIHNISTPRREDVIAYREQLKAAGYKAATVQAYIIAVRQFFKWAEIEGIYKNVADHIKGAKISSEHKRDALTTTQAQTVLSGTDTSTESGARDYAILAMMMTGGLRTTEVIHADIGDMRAQGDNMVIYLLGKGRQEKTDFVVLAPEAEAAIRHYLSFRGKTSGSDPLFTSRSHRNAGGRMTTRSISRLVKNHLKGAGYDSERLTAHSLRHTAATINLLNGASESETQQHLRHSKIDTTMIYAHHLDKASNRSAQRIAAALFNGKPFPAKG